MQNKPHLLEPIFSTQAPFEEAVKTSFNLLAKLVFWKKHFFRIDRKVLARMTCHHWFAQILKESKICGKGGTLFAPLCEAVKVESRGVRLFLMWLINRQTDLQTFGMITEKVFFIIQEKADANRFAVTFDTKHWHFFSILIARKQILYGVRAKRSGNFKGWNFWHAQSNGQHFSFHKIINISFLIQVQLQNL